MSLLDLPMVKSHLRLDDDYPDEQVEPYMLAAELSAQQFLNRRVFATQSAMATAVAAVPAALSAATAAHTAAIEAANEIEDAVERCAAIAYADEVYRAAHEAAQETRYGIVINDLIKAGMLLILGHLYENRQDVQAGVSAVQIPMGSHFMLQPYRIGLGV